MTHQQAVDLVVTFFRYPIDQRLDGVAVQQRPTLGFAWTAGRQCLGDGFSGWRRRCFDADNTLWTAGDEEPRTATLLHPPVRTVVPKASAHLHTAVHVHHLQFAPAVITLLTLEPTCF